MTSVQDSRAIHQTVVHISIWTKVVEQMTDIFMAKKPPKQKQHRMLFLLLMYVTLKQETIQVNMFYFFLFRAFKTFTRAGIN